MTNPSYESFLMYVLYSRVIEDLVWTLRGFVCHMVTFRWMSLKFFIMSNGRYNEDKTLAGNVRQHCHI